jgi:Tfp pilus assembly protein PilP
MALALLALLSAPAALAQQQSPPLPVPPPPPSEQIDEMLEQEEEVFEGAGYSYDAGNRRDPFRSLLQAEERPDLRGPRPEGIAGLLIDEISLTGIFQTPRGWVAQVVSSDQKKSYLIRDGDQLYDGDVVRINRGEVVFNQILNDPTALKPFREVTKKLSP